MSQDFEFIIAFDDFDASVLPMGARTSGSEAFVTALRELVENEFAGHGGWATILVDEGSRLLKVTWGSGAEGYGGSYRPQSSTSRMQQDSLRETVMCESHSASHSREAVEQRKRFCSFGRRLQSHRRTHGRTEISPAV